MTAQPNQPSLDDLLKDLVSVHYEHPNAHPDCNVTITVEVKPKAKAQLERLITEARIDELQRLQPGSSKIETIHGDWITVADRIAQLQATLTEPQRGEE